MNPELHTQATETHLTTVVLSMDGTHVHRMDLTCNHTFVSPNLIMRALPQGRPLRVGLASVAVILQWVPPSTVTLLTVNFMYMASDGCKRITNSSRMLSWPGSEAARGEEAGGRGTGSIPH